MGFWRWDCESLIQNPTHTYGAPGVYSVTLTIRAFDLETEFKKKDAFIEVFLFQLRDLLLMQMVVQFL